VGWCLINAEIIKKRCFLAAKGA
jgi:hypothetical protein